MYRGPCGNVTHWQHSDEKRALEPCTLSPGHCSARIGCRPQPVGKRCRVLSMSRARIPWINVSPPRIDVGALLRSAAVLPAVIRLFVVASGAAWLAACAPSPVVTGKSEWFAPSRQAALERPRRTVFVRDRRLKLAKRHAPSVSDHSADEAHVTSRGVASFYTEGTQTASGETLDGHELTAAHRTLPFGTRLRVTDVDSGRSVVVRVNDRGPYVHGREVDVSYSAAEALGMVGKGTAKVKLDVVQ
jgi:rare lipoprotein A